MKKFIIIILLFTVCLPFSAKAQQVVFFDNFESGVLDLTKWIDVDPGKGEEAISNAAVYEGTGSLLLYGSDGATGGPCNLRTVGSLNLTSAIIDFYVYIDAGLLNQGVTSLRLFDANGNYIFKLLLFSQNHIFTPPALDPIYYQNIKSGPEIVLTPNFYIDLNNWYHITISYTGSQAVININDNKYISTIPTNPNAGPLDYVEVTAGKQSSDYNLSYFDNFTIYNSTLATQTWYKDYDSDGYGNPNQSMSASSQPYGYVSDKTDCNDNDSSIHPGATEIVGDGIDQDCDGSDLKVSATVPFIDPPVVNGTTITQTFIPAGNDLGKAGNVYVFTYGASGQYWGGSAWTATETPYLKATTLGSMSVVYNVTGLPVGTKIYIGYGIGQSATSATMDANGTFLLAYTTIATTSSKIWYKDYDGDGYGNPNQSMSASSQPYGYVSDKTDCNDNDSSIHPGATEIAGDGIDQDCDGSDKISASNTITIESDLSFKFLDAIYKSLLGDISLWADFKFFGDQSGKLLWELENYGTTTSPGNPITIESDLSFNFDATYNSLLGDIDLEANFKFFGDQNGKMLWELDSYTVK